MTARLASPALVLGLLFGLAAGPATADDQPVPIQLRIKDHRFSPAEVHIPADKPALLVVRNEDGSAEEMESKPLQIEKVIPRGATSKVRLRPLAPGRYTFFGEYHPDTAQGAVIAE